MCQCNFGFCRCLTQKTCNFLYYAHLFFNYFVGDFSCAMAKLGMLTGLNLLRSNIAHNNENDVILPDRTQWSGKRICCILPDRPFSLFTGMPVVITFRYSAGFTRRTIGEPIISAGFFKLKRLQPARLICCTHRFSSRIKMALGVVLIT